MKFLNSYYSSFLNSIILPNKVKYFNKNSFISLNKSVAPPLKFIIYGYIIT